MPASYIPATDAGFAAWLLNFSTLLTADPTAYGLTAPDAVLVDAENTAYAAALLLATDPATRTAPTVAAKDAARRSAEAVVRPYAMQINAMDGVTDEQRADLGLTIRKTVPTPVPAPLSSPVLALVSIGVGTMTLGFSDADAPSGKAKPAGSIGVELFRAIGVAPAVDPSLAAYTGTITKSPTQIAFSGADNGQIASFFARFVTRSGPGGKAQVGPWSAVLSATINA